jgi:hypothetical protein
MPCLPFLHQAQAQSQSTLIHPDKSRLNMAAQPPAKRPHMQKTGTGDLDSFAEKHGATITDGKMLLVDTRVSVMKDHMVMCNIGGSDPITQRMFGLQLVKDMAAEGLLKGFDSDIHEIVVPHTTFHAGTKIYTPDAGSHLTLLLHKDNPIPENAEQLVGGRAHRMGFDLNSIRFLLGRPDNDEAVRAVYYVAATVWQESQEFARDIQNELKVQTITNYFPHVSLAAIAPRGSRELEDVKKLRSEWAPEYPAHGFPPVITELKRWRCRCCGAPLR